MDIIPIIHYYTKCIIFSVIINTHTYPIKNYNNMKGGYNSNSMFISKSNLQSTLFKYSTNIIFIVFTVFFSFQYQSMKQNFFESFNDYKP